MYVLQKYYKSSKKITAFTEITKYNLRNVCCNLQIKNMSYMLIDLKKNNALMFKVLKSINIFESKNRFIYQQIRMIFDFKQVQSCAYSRRII